ARGAHRGAQGALRILARRPASSRRAIVTVVALALVGAACSSGGRRRPTTTTAPPPTTTTTQPPAYPLTGLPADDPARLGRQALVVKIENHPAARPQSGLDAAD